MYCASRIFHTGTKDNVLHLMKTLYFELMRRDFTFPLYVGFYKIYNLACSGLSIHYQPDSVQATKTGASMVLLTCWVWLNVSKLNIPGSHELSM
jgi:hypothetical protein